MNIEKSNNKKGNITEFNNDLLVFAYAQKLGANEEDFPIPIQMDINFDQIDNFSIGEVIYELSQRLNKLNGEERDKLYLLFYNTTKQEIKAIKLLNISIRTQVAEIIEGLKEVEKQKNTNNTKQIPKFISKLKKELNKNFKEKHSGELNERLRSMISEIATIIAKSNDEELKTVILQIERDLDKNNFLVKNRDTDELLELMKNISNAIYSKEENYEQNRTIFASLFNLDTYANISPENTVLEKTEPLGQGYFKNLTRDDFK